MTLRSCSLAWSLAATILLAASPAGADQPSDAWITTKVKIALLAEDQVDGLGIDVDTVEGRVTLHGKVDNEAAKERAAGVARDVEGVREVQDMLVVVPEEARAEVDREDAELERQIETVLSRDQALEGSDIEVASVHDGVVVLEGEAATLSAHRRALENVRAIQGVRGITSEIRSPDELGDREIWSEDTTAESSTSAASDTWITTKTKLRLMASQGLSPFAINVDTRGGVVTLFGTVSSDEIKERAGAEARQVEGVRAVENELQVVPEAVAEQQEETDEAVQARVRERLSQAEGLEDADIDVAVRNNVVRLTGSVGSQKERVRALTVARGAPGAESVIDDLRVRTAEERPTT